VNPKKLMRQVQEMQDKLARDLEALRVEGSAGGGVVVATLNGQKQLLALRIAREAITPDDPEMLQDLIVAAVGEAGRMVDEEMGDRLGGLAGGMGIPGLF
jgi:hypothetical protein